jgi:hypothetical protein
MIISCPKRKLIITYLTKNKKITLVVAEEKISFQKEINYQKLFIN